MANSSKTQMMDDDKETESVKEIQTLLGSICYTDISLLLWKVCRTLEQSYSRFLLCHFCFCYLAKADNC